MEKEIKILFCLGILLIANTFSFFVLSQEPDQEKTIHGKLITEIPDIDEVDQSDLKKGDMWRLPDGRIVVYEGERSFEAGEVLE